MSALDDFLDSNPTIKAALREDQGKGKEEEKEEEKNKDGVSDTGAIPPSTCTGADSDNRSETLPSSFLRSVGQSLEDEIAVESLINSLVAGPNEDEKVSAETKTTPTPKNTKNTKTGDFNLLEGIVSGISGNGDRTSNAGTKVHKSPKSKAITSASIILSSGGTEQEPANNIVDPLLQRLQRLEAGAEAEAEAEPTISIHDLEELAQIQSEYAFDPHAWCKDVANFKPDYWQDKALEEFVEYRFVAWSAGSGVGKTALLAITILFFLSTRPFPRVPCTAPSKHQLYNVLWAEISKWVRKSNHLEKFFKWSKTRVEKRGKHASEWFAVATTGRTSSKEKTAAVEGLQGFHEGNILFVVDESSGVPDQVMVAVEGSLTTGGAHAILASNPTRTSGFFHKTITDRKARKYWKVRFIDAEEVAKRAAHVDIEAINRVAEVYGRNSDYFRVKVRGLPPLSDAQALVSPEQMYEARDREVEVTEKDLRVGSCDPARYGSDPAMFYVRKGLKLYHREILSRASTIECAQKAFDLIENFDLDFFYIDEIGLGSGVLDNLRALIKKHKHHCKVVGVHVGSTPVEKWKNPPDRIKKEKEKFTNLRSQLFFYTRFLIDEIQIVFDEDLLDEELTSIAYQWTHNDAKIRVESKDTIKDKIGRSPNDADAFILAFFDELVKRRKIDVPARQFDVGSRNEGIEKNPYANNSDSEAIIGPFSRLKSTSRFGVIKGGRDGSNFGGGSRTGKAGRSRYDALNPSHHTNRSIRII
jgi:hypothetical protein